MMDMITITDDRITAYVESLMPRSGSLLRRLEEEAQAEGIPIIRPAAAAFLRMLCEIQNPRNILEIGTAIGYSTIHMAEAAARAEVVTIEIDSERAARAALNFQEAGLAERIRLIEGDALEHLPSMRETFDLIFIDAAKGKYVQFMEEAFRLCAPGGIIVSDNVLYRGLTALPPEEVNRRHRSTARRLREYNEWLANHPGLSTTFLTVGDGMAVSRKR
jgi:caffeoyl-CoA O-methyltransferase